MARHRQFPESSHAASGYSLRARAIWGSLIALAQSWGLDCLRSEAIGGNEGFRWNHPRDRRFARPHRQPDSRRTDRLFRLAPHQVVSQPKKFVLLGATGSIGENTLRVLRKHSDKLQLVGISARKQADKLAEIAHEFSVPYACLEHPPDSGVSFPDQTKLLLGQEGIESLAALDEADTTVVAVVGAAGLLPTLSAVKAGKNIVLANKEALVVGGEMVMQAATRYGATIIPADSEHNAVFQCIQGQSDNSLDSIVLTASGGPFRDLPVEEFENVTLEQALNLRIGRWEENYNQFRHHGQQRTRTDRSPLAVLPPDWSFHPPTSLVHAIVGLSMVVALPVSPPSMTFAFKILCHPERAPKSINLGFLSSTRSFPFPLLATGVG